MSTGEYYHLDFKRLEIEDVFFDAKKLEEVDAKITDDYIKYNGYPYHLSIEDNGSCGEGTYLVITHELSREPVFGFRLRDIETTPLMDILEFIKKRRKNEQS